MNRFMLGCIAAFILAPCEQAMAVTDPAGDFLPTHSGPALASVDILEAQVLRFGGSFLFLSSMNGPLIDTRTTYVWGVDRGAGTPGLFTGNPPVGPGVTFDAVVVMRIDGSSTVTAFNDGAPPTITQLPASVAVAGNQMLGFVDYALLPSRGFGLSDYRFNLWTRTGGGNTGIADLAQGEGTFGAVPEPASWAMLIAGFGLVGGAARRRRVAFAA
jgi:hypothetical protein